MQKFQRIKRELFRMNSTPTQGISCTPKDENTLDVLTAVIIGPQCTPYENGTFQLEIHIPDKYPFVPPMIKFVTPIYHPNIDNAGRICMDNLKMPPKGTWAPQIALENLLISIRLLMTNPNPDDPLMPDIAEEYKSSREQFESKAREYTKKYAIIGEPSTLLRKRDKELTHTVVEDISGDTARVDEQKRFGQDKMD
ncbi:ubiquitin-conjugating enzyme E2 T-like [Chrysoperla carnea]|uniref:ubiquitin-conjugating enzyme E2 T-like n=1 Tax=Chrysoperla carnea TaxID=189513 RepID=UPI001D07A60E|nr:ubiquitin-conjugating enzyme E2 T-like [Chrysoperla carnea]